MTQDEMERTMQFILQQQAQFSTSMHEVRDEIRQLGKRHGELQGAVITVTGLVGGLVEAQAELARSHQELARSHQELVKAQAHTEERLSAFITFVERYISEAGRN